MAIVKMTHFSLLYFTKYREKILSDLQRFRDIHFINLAQGDEFNDLESVRIPEHLDRVDRELDHHEWMIDVLKPYDQRPGGLKGMKEGVPSMSIEELMERASSINVGKLYYELRNHVERMDELKSERQALLDKTHELEPWKDMHYDPKEFELSESQVITGYVARRFYDQLKEDLRELTLTVSEEYGNVQNNQYMLFITHLSERDHLLHLLRKYGFNELDIPSQEPIKKELAAIEERLSSLNQDYAELESKMPGFAEHLEEVEISYESHRMDALRYGAATHFKKTAMFDVVEGYVPEESFGDLQRLLAEKYSEVALLEEKAFIEDEEVPIKLKNNKFVSAFESLTKMYSLPKYTEVDPTPLFAPFYLFFFGMMVADIGYGLILLIATAVALKFFNLKPGTKSFIRLFHYLSYGVIFWGGIYGSFFGGVIKLPALIDTQADFIPLLIISIAFGAIHIFFALGIKAYLLIRDGKGAAVFFDVISWYFALVGAGLFLVSGALGLPEMVKTIGMVLMILGMGTILLFGARDAKSIGGRLAGGAYELYGISGYVGDLVSYSRLMAIGLAGGFIGFAVNMIVELLSGSIIGIVVGFVVFVIFHAFNIFLSLLSGYVHTARLTYVEFFGKFYEGGGKTFKEFVTEPKYVSFKEKN